MSKMQQQKGDENTKEQGYYFLIPSVLVEEGDHLKALLFGLLFSLSNKYGFCWATNKYLSQAIGRKDTSIVSKKISELEREGWIYSEVNQDNGNKRKIFINPIPIRKKTDTSMEITQDPSMEITQYNNINNNNKYKYKSDDLKMANLLADLIEENNVKAWKRPTGSQIEAWADSIEKLHRLDNVDYQSIEMIIRWCQQDSFWKANILSTAKLRKQFPTLFAQAKRHAQKALTPSI